MNKKKNAFSTLMDASKTSQALLNSRFTVGTVAESQLVYQNERNNETFLKNYATELRGKPSIYEKI